MLDAGLSGIYHLGSRGAITKYEFGINAAKVFELDSTLIQPTSSDNAELSAVRPQDLTLDVDKMELALGEQMPNSEEGIIDFRALERDGYPAKLAAMVLERA